MARSNLLRAQIEGLLEDIKTQFSLSEVSYNHARDDKMYPHVTWEILSVNVSDFFRRDYTVDIDIYTYDDQPTALDIGDAVEDLLNALNDPTNDILPTYFLVTRQSVEDTDTHIKHEVIRVQVQLYERGDS